MARSGKRKWQTITKKDMVFRLAAKTGMERAACRHVLQTLLDEVAAELARGNRLEFRHFGVFTAGVRKARVGRNPSTRRTMTIPARVAVRFKAGRGLSATLTRQLLPAQAAESEK